MTFIKLLVLSLVFAITAADKKCEGYHINGVFHKKHVITNGLNRPYQLSIIGLEHHTLYFSYNVGGDDEDKFEIGYLKRGAKIPTPIPTVKNGFATAINKEHGLVYLGGSEGIFSHEINKHHNNEHIVKGHNIWDMFYKNHLYFISYPSQRLYRKHENSSELVETVKEKVYQFAIDGDDDMFICTENGVFLVKNGTHERSRFSGPSIFRAVEVNNNGVVHFAGQSAIYVANKDNNKLEEIAQIKNIFGLTFDNNNTLVYSNPHEIVKLLPGTCK